MKIAIKPEVLAQMVEDELVLVQMNSDRTFSLDKVGIAFWNAIEPQSGDMEKIIDTLAGRFDVSVERLRDDLKVLVDELLEADLVSTANSPG